MQIKQQEKSSKLGTDVILIEGDEINDSERRPSKSARTNSGRDSRRGSRRNEDEPKSSQSRTPTAPPKESKKDSSSQGGAASYRTIAKSPEFDNTASELNGSSSKSHTPFGGASSSGSKSLKDRRSSLINRLQVDGRIELSPEIKQMEFEYYNSKSNLESLLSLKVRSR